MVFSSSKPAGLLFIIWQTWNRKLTPFAEIEIMNITKLPVISCKYQFVRQLQANLISLIKKKLLSKTFLKTKKYNNKRCSSNCSYLQARTYLFWMSKPAGIWWEHLFMGNSSWCALLSNSITCIDNLEKE